ncbi:MAG: radical SAM/SPASM domain-containing protein [Planctomycetota bacterium]|nr:MAG: radical SAM/SPASM domain-containing protein [Planctomycetota bacterium]
MSVADARGEESWLAQLAPLGPRQITVLLDVSNKCNIRCRMCYFSYDAVFHRKSRFLEPARFRDIAAQLFPLAHTVYLSAGSEPLTSPHFEELLRIAAPYRVPDLKFLTNGLLLTPSLSRALVECGVRQIHVSMDGARRETYEWARRGASYDRLVANLRELESIKRELHSELPWVQINATVMRRNLAELPEFVDVALGVGATRIACRHLMAYDGLEMEAESPHLDKPATNRALRALMQRAVESKRVAIVNLPDPFALDGAAGAAEAGDREPDDAPTARPAPEPGALALAAARPFGHVDTPAELHVRAAGDLELTGWALARDEVVAVECWREPLGAGEPVDGELGLVLLGRARFLAGMRVDVAQRHPDIEQRYRSAWSYVLPRAELPDVEGALLRLHVIARDRVGRRAELGQRTVVRARADEQPYLYCRRPFDCVYIDSAGDVYPYPDCQSLDPFAHFDGSGDFKSLWRSAPFESLRRAIVENRPPKMCVTCPDRINRNVDDQAFFEERVVRAAYARPLGFLEQVDARDDGRALVWSGWALAPEQAVRVELLRVRADAGPEHLGFAEPAPHERADVARAYPRIAAARHSAFELCCTSARLGDGAHALVLRAVGDDAVATELGAREVTVRDGRVQAIGAAAPRGFGLGSRERFV